IDVAVPVDVDLLATLEAQDEIVWYENSGTGTFLARRTLGATLDRPRGIAFADVDDDGVPDVHYGSVGVDNTSWFRGLGGGSYAPSQALIEDVSAIASASLGVADIDGDGALEPWADGLIVDGPSGGGDGVRWTDTDGPPSGWTTSTVGTPFRLVTGTTALDADGDGLPEVAVTSIRGVVVIGNEPVGAEFGTEQLVATFADSGSSPQSADLDGDGAADVLITLGQFSGTHGVYVAYGDGAGGFGPLETVGLTAPAFTETGFRTADLEGDGDLDVLVTDNFFTSEARWFVNEGARTFSEGPFFGVPIARNATVLDLDGDGAAELVQVSGSCALEYLDSAPGGLFDPPVVVANCASGIGARAGDVTGDGLVDLVLFDNDLGVFGYLPGLGGGAFGATVTIAPSNGGTPQGILVGDVDLDGNLDIVASQDDEAFWVPNAGGGSFGAPRPLTLALGPLRGDAQLVDLDGDGDLDLLNGAAFLLNDALLGARSCTAGAPNSTGERGTLTAVGSASTLDNDLSLIAGELPAGEVGMFLVAPVGASVPNPGGSQGTLCLGGSIGRFNRPTEIQQASTAGTIRLRVDLTNVPNGPGSESLVPGDTRFFQLWHRDTGLGAPAGFTAGLRVEFR
ncbi:MAG: VCBS repeat-containing protein, partial [Planctomycetota bacterium]